MSVTFIPIKDTPSWRSKMGRFFLYKHGTELYLTDCIEKRMRMFSFLYSMYDWLEETWGGVPKFRYDDCGIIEQDFFEGEHNMTSSSGLVDQLIGIVTDAKTNAEQAKYDIEEKQSKLEDLHTEIEDGLNNADGFLDTLTELDEVINKLEDTVQEFESEF
tara:strand:+ start:7795 stop:8274 length:480 start_codon:yes stop_codon:yes gene_type:complete